MSDDDFSLADQYTQMADALNPTPWAEGEYEMLCVKADAAKTQAGKHCLRMVFRVLSGPGKKDRELFTQWTWSPESDNAALIFSTNLSNMGATQAWIIKERPSMPAIANKIRGARVSGFVRNRDFNGEPRPEISVKKLLAPGSGAAGAGAGVASDSVDLAGLSAEDLDIDTDAATTTPDTSSAPSGGAAEKVLVPDTSGDVASDLDWP